MNSVSSIKDCVKKTRIELKNHFNADAIFYLQEKVGRQLSPKAFGNLELFSNKEFGVAVWVFDNKKPAGKFTYTLPNTNLQYFPLLVSNKILGVIGIRFQDTIKPQLDTAMLLNSFINLIASTINREINIDIVKDNQIQLASQNLFQTIMNSVSHELRTPISIIVGASDNLLNKETKISAENKSKLITEISVAAFRLNHLVDNLLNMQRLESGLLKIKPDWCDINELINRPINRLQSELANHKTDIAIEQGFPLIKLDFGLIEQAIFNIIHNASLYTPLNSTIHVSAIFNDGKTIITIEDEGKGFTEEEKEHLFKKFYRANNTSSGGTGLGLSISKGFIEAHNGTLSVYDNIPRGARFVIQIPTEFIKLDETVEFNDFIK